MKEAAGDERCLDPQLWHACAGGMVQMPPVRSRVYYFPQGHAEHAHGGGEHARVVEGAVTVEVPRGADRGERDAGVPPAGGERVQDGGEIGL